MELYLLKSTISLEKNNLTAFFLHVDANSWKLKVDREILGWASSKNEGVLYGHRPFRSWDSKTLCISRMNEWS